MRPADADQLALRPVLLVLFGGIGQDAVGDVLDVVGIELGALHIVAAAVAPRRRRNLRRRSRGSGASMRGGGDNDKPSKKRGRPPKADPIVKKEKTTDDDDPDELEGADVDPRLLDAQRRARQSSAVGLGDSK